MIIFPFLAVAVDAFANVPYVYQVYKGIIRPHPFTWFIWTCLTLLMAIVQFYEGAGGGSWLLFSTSVFNTLIVILSIRYGTRDIKKVDYVVLAFCLGCFPLYFLFEMPIMTALVITIIDCVSFIPMLRKSIKDPYGESAMFQWMMVVAYGFSLLSMQTYSIATCLFPAAMVVTHGLSCVFLIVLRRKIPV
jgi:hypothetical protein